MLEVALKVTEIVLKVLEVVLKVLESALYMLEIVNGVRCVLWVLGFMLCMLFCLLLCSEGRGRRPPFARGTRVMCYVLEAEKDVRHVL